MDGCSSGHNLRLRRIQRRAHNIDAGMGNLLFQIQPRLYVAACVMPKITVLNTLNSREWNRKSTLNSNSLKTWVRAQLLWRLLTLWDTYTEMHKFSVSHKFRFLFHSRNGSFSVSTCIIDFYAIWNVLLDTVPNPRSLWLHRTAGGSCPPRRWVSYKFKNTF